MDITNLGAYASIDALWAAHPEGGKEGDYCTISGVKYRWNKYDRIWENTDTVTASNAHKIESTDDLNVHNNLAIGGKATIQGNSIFKGDLKVEGWLRANNVKVANKGLFATETALKAAYPSPNVGDWALVGDTIPANIYRCSTKGTWTATGEQGGNEGIDVEQYENQVAALQSDVDSIEKGHKISANGNGSGTFKNNIITINALKGEIISISMKATTSVTYGGGSSTSQKGLFYQVTAHYTDGSIAQTGLASNIGDTSLAKDDVVSVNFTPLKDVESIYVIINCGANEYVDVTIVKQDSILGKLNATNTLIVQNKQEASANLNKVVDSFKATTKTIHLVTNPNSSWSYGDKISAEAFIGKCYIKVKTLSALTTSNRVILRKISNEGVYDVIDQLNYIEKSANSYIFNGIYEIEEGIKSIMLDALNVTDVTFELEIASQNSFAYAEYINNNTQSELDEIKGTQAFVHESVVSFGTSANWVERKVDIPSNVSRMYINIDAGTSIDDKKVQVLFRDSSNTNVGVLFNSQITKSAGDNIYSSFVDIPETATTLVLTFMTPAENTYSLKLYSSDAVKFYSKKIDSIEQNVSVVDGQVSLIEDKLGHEKTYTWNNVNSSDVLDYNLSFKSGDTYVFELVEQSLPLTNYKSFVLTGYCPEESKFYQEVYWLNGVDKGFITKTFTRNVSYCKVQIYALGDRPATITAKLRYYKKEYDHFSEGIDNNKTSINTINSTITGIQSNIDVLKTQVASKLSAIPAKSVGLSELTDVVRGMLGTGGSGGSGISVDDEDLTIVDGVAKFKDKSASDSLTNVGLHFVRKNVVSGFNKLTASMLQANAINIIQYDYDNNGDSLTCPAGCILMFVGGIIRNTTITGNHTKIEAPLHQIFDNVSLEGTFDIKSWYVDWFGTGMVDGEQDWSPTIKKAMQAVYHYYFCNLGEGNYNASAIMFPVRFANRVYECKTPITTQSIMDAENALYASRGVTKNFATHFVCLEGDNGAIISNKVDSDSFGGDDISDLDDVTYLFTAGSTTSRGYVVVQINNLRLYGTGRNTNCGFLKIPKWESSSANTWINRLSIRNCVFHSMANFLYLAKSCYWCRIESNHFYYAQTGVWMVDGNSSSITNNHFGTNGMHLLIDGGVGINITGNDFSGGTYGIKLVSASSGEGGNCGNISIQGNYFEVDATIEGSKDIILGDTNHPNGIYSNIVIKCNTPELLRTETTYDRYFIPMYGKFTYCDIEGFVEPHMITGSKGNTGKLYYGSSVNETNDIKPYFSWYVDLTKDNAPMVIKQ